MDKEVTYQEFVDEVSKWWRTVEYGYGSLKIAADKAKLEFEKNGVTNTQEMYERYRISKGDQFYHAGD